MLQCERFIRSFPVRSFCIVSFQGFSGFLCTGQRPSRAPSLLWFCVWGHTFHFLLWSDLKVLFSFFLNFPNNLKGSPVCSLISLISSGFSGFHVTNWRIMVFSIFSEPIQEKALTFPAKPMLNLLGWTQNLSDIRGSVRELLPPMIPPRTVFMLTMATTSTQYHPKCVRFQIREALVMQILYFMTWA